MTGTGTGADSPPAPTARGVSTSNCAQSCTAECRFVLNWTELFDSELIPV